MTTIDLSPLYDAYYFQHGCGLPYERTPEWLAVFERIAIRIQKTIGPANVLDAGCAMGFLVEKLRDLGIETYGIDISTHALNKIRDDIKPFCWFGSIAEPFSRNYELIVCIEVLEHMPRVEAEKAIVNFCQYTDDIIFSSTPADFTEVTHINVQPLEYWLELFAWEGFFRDLDYDASYITPWAVRVRRRRETLPRLIREYERAYSLLYKENSELRKLAIDMRQQLAKQGQSHEQLEVIRNSLSWQMGLKLGNLLSKIAPPNTLRAHLLSAVLAAIKTLLAGGQSRG